MNLDVFAKTYSNVERHVINSARSALTYKERESAQLLQDVEKFCKNGEMIEVLPSSHVPKGYRRKIARHPVYGR